MANDGNLVRIQSTLMMKKMIKGAEKTQCSESIRKTVEAGSWRKQEYIGTKKETLIGLVNAQLKTHKTPKLHSRPQICTTTLKYL